MTKREKFHATTLIKESNKLGSEGTNLNPNAWKMRCAALSRISKIFSRGFLKRVTIGIRYNVTITENLIKAIIFNYKA